MLNLHASKLVYTDKPLISQNLVVLLILSDSIFDNEPLLYVGQNNNKDYIIGSSVEEGNYNGSYIHRYFHTIITRNQCISYFNKEVSYRDLLESSNKVYIIDLFSLQNRIDVYEYTIDAIDQSYIPYEGTYVPEYDGYLYSKEDIKQLLSTE